MNQILNGQAASDRDIITTRVVNAPRELVYTMYTDEDHIVKWWGPKGFTTTIRQMEVRPDGLWLFTMHGPDGVDYPNVIRYIAVQPPERLEYVHSDTIDAPTQTFHVVVTFDEVGSQTRVTMRARFATKEERDEIAKYAIEGGNSTMDCLEEYLATLA